MIRSKHNNLLNYFIFNKKDLSKAYVRKCEKFLKELNLQASGNKPQASGNKHKGTGLKQHA
jgi:hypothetical protein